jgi:hypothetical protein
VRGFAPGRNVIPTEDTAFTQHLAAATEQGKLFNDRPASRGGTPDQKRAGANWTRLMGERIKAHGAPEVERLVKEYQGQQADPYYQAIAKSRGDEGAYWADRANAIIEAAKKAETAGVDVPAFTLKRGGKPYFFTPTGGSTSAVPIRSAESVAPAPEAVYADPIRATLDHFATAKRETQRSVGWNMQRLMDAPDGFAKDGPFTAFRKEMYRRGAWSQTIDNPDAYARYQAVRDLHAGIHGPTAGDTVFRRGPITPLSPDQRLDTIDGMMRGAPRNGSIVTSIATESRAHLDRMGLGHVRLHYTDAIDTETGDLAPAFGQFQPEIDEISLAVQYTSDAVADDLLRSLDNDFDALLNVINTPDFANLVKRSLYQTMNHEALHALRAANVITDGEWKLLATEAQRRDYGTWALDAYGPDVKTGKQIYKQDNVFDAMTKGFDQYEEEAVAEMFGDFALDAKTLSGATRTIFQKITDFFTGLVKAVLRQPDGVAVMKRMLSGEVGARIPYTTPVNPYTGNTRYLQQGKASSLLNRPDPLITEEDPRFHGMPLTTQQAGTADAAL